MASPFAISVRFSVREPPVGRMYTTPSGVVPISGGAEDVDVAVAVAVAVFVEVAACVAVGVGVNADEVIDGTNVGG